MKHRQGLDRFIPAFTGIVLAALVLTDCVQKNCQQTAEDRDFLRECSRGNLYSCLIVNDTASNLWANRISFNQLPPDVRKTIFQIDLQIRTANCQAIGYIRPDPALSTR